LFTWSAWSGIDKGIKTLSNVNMFLAFIVLIKNILTLLSVLIPLSIPDQADHVNNIVAIIINITCGLFIVGPTLYILNTFTNGLGNYIFNFFSMSLRIPMNKLKI
jgi:glycine betaine transporter